MIGVGWTLVWGSIYVVAYLLTILVYLCPMPQDTNVLDHSKSSGFRQAIPPKILKLEGKHS